MRNSYMKKMIYIMNVEWNWIKQRPHFIAEELGKHYEIYIVYQYKYNRTGLQSRKEDDLRLIPIKTIPKITSIEKLKWINEHIMAQKVKKLIHDVQPDYIYFTFPTQVNMLPEDYKGKVIYDCMDNHSAFYKKNKEKKVLEQQEKKLINLSSNTLVSSDYLRKVISKRYDLPDTNFDLVRNAYDGRILENVKYKNMTDVFRMAYVGTISSWFDWDTVISAMDNVHNTELHLYGPLDKATSIPKHNRILYHGTIEHDRLYSTIENMDCLIMPFIINEIIKAVDPVKIYEYINFNKDIIMCRYDEVIRFDDFVYFYQSVDDFIKAIENIRNNPHVKYTNLQRIEFLKSNDWHSRVRQIESIIEQ